MTIKQRIGKKLLKNLPVSKHVFDHFRLEMNAMWVRFLTRIHPGYRVKIRNLRKKKNLLLNLGCGPYGKAEGWINLDLFPIQHVYIRSDSRKKLIVADESCAGIHVEMFLEHLDPVDELPFLLSECYRALQTGGVLRIIVPDAEKFLIAYFHDGWGKFNEISYGGDDWSKIYKSKMEAINHVFLQEYEHYGGWDYNRLCQSLTAAGFTDIMQVGFGEGRFPGGAIDRPYHQTNGLYVEAIK